MKASHKPYLLFHCLSSESLHQDKQKFQHRSRILFSADKISVSSIETIFSIRSIPNTNEGSLSIPIQTPSYKINKENFRRFKRNHSCEFFRFSSYSNYLESITKIKMDVFMNVNCILWIKNDIEPSSPERDHVEKLKLWRNLLIILKELLESDPNNLTKSNVIHLICETQKFIETLKKRFYILSQVSAEILIGLKRIGRIIHLLGLLAKTEIPKYEEIPSPHHINQNSLQINGFLELTTLNFKRFYEKTMLFEKMRHNSPNKRKDQILEYYKWKLRDWCVEHKKIKLRKYKEVEIQCKICLKNIPCSIFREHSEFCKYKAYFAESLNKMRKKAMGFVTLFQEIRIFLLTKTKLDIKNLRNMKNRFELSSHTLLLKSQTANPLDSWRFIESENLENESNDDACSLEMLETPKPIPFIKTQSDIVGETDKLSQSMKIGIRPNIIINEPNNYDSVFEDKFLIQNSTPSSNNSNRRSCPNIKLSSHHPTKMSDFAKKLSPTTQFSFEKKDSTDFPQTLWMEKPLKTSSPTEQSFFPESHKSIDNDLGKNLIEPVSTKLISGHGFKESKFKALKKFEKEEEGEEETLHVSLNEKGMIPKNDTILYRRKSGTSPMVSNTMLEEILKKNLAKQKGELLPQLKEKNENFIEFYSDANFNSSGLPSSNSTSKMNSPLMGSPFLFNLQRQKNKECLYKNDLEDKLSQENKEILTKSLENKNSLNSLNKEFLKKSLKDKASSSKKSLGKGFFGLFSEAKEYQNSSKEKADNQKFTKEKLGNSKENSSKEKNANKISFKDIGNRSKEKKELSEEKLLYKNFEGENELNSMNSKEELDLLNTNSREELDLKDKKHIKNHLSKKSLEKLNESYLSDSEESIFNNGQQKEHNIIIKPEPSIIRFGTRNRVKTLLVIGSQSNEKTTEIHKHKHTTDMVNSEIINPMAKMKAEQEIYKQQKRLIRKNDEGIQICSLFSDMMAYISENEYVDRLGYRIIKVIFKLDELAILIPDKKKEEKNRIFEAKEFLMDYKEIGEKFQRTSQFLYKLQADLLKGKDLKVQRENVKKSLIKKDNKHNSDSVEVSKRNHFTDRIDRVPGCAPHLALRLNHAKNLNKYSKFTSKILPVSGKTTPSNKNKWDGYSNSKTYYNIQEANPFYATNLEKLEEKSSASKASNSIKGQLKSKNQNQGFSLHNEEDRVFSLNNEEDRVFSLHNEEDRVFLSNNIKNRSDVSIKKKEESIFNQISSREMGFSYHEKNSFEQKKDLNVLPFQVSKSKKQEKKYNKPEKIITMVRKNITSLSKISDPDFSNEKNLNNQPQSRQNKNDFLEIQHTSDFNKHQSSHLISNQQKTHESTERAVTSQELFPTIKRSSTFSDIKIKCDSKPQISSIKLDNPRDNNNKESEQGSKYMAVIDLLKKRNKLDDLPNQTLEEKKLNFQRKRNYGVKRSPLEKLLRRSSVEVLTPLTSPDSIGDKNKNKKKKSIKAICSDEESPSLKNQNEEKFKQSLENCTEQTILTVQSKNDLFYSNNRLILEKLVKGEANTSSENSQDESFELREEDYFKGYYSDSYIPSQHIHFLDIRDKRKHEIGIENFEFINLIGKGAFGRVYLVKRKETGDQYAMKIINTMDNMNKNKYLSLKNESKVFDLVYSDFVVKALFKFGHEKFYCFVMEYMYGGDFNKILQKYESLDHRTAKFYIAELVLAVEHLHNLGIVHRDLKPDNILLDAKGHIKLTDFGLSEVAMATLSKHKQTPLLSREEKFKNLIEKLKINEDYIEDSHINYKLDIVKTQVDEKNKTDDIIQENDSPKRKSIRKVNKNMHRIIGTPDYIAPEIVNGSGSLSSPCIDWWSVGVILFEFLTGIPPFNDDSPEKIFENISNLKIEWEQIPIGYEEDQMRPDAADLIKKFLTVDPEKRLGYKGVEEIKNHPFFYGTDWNNLIKSNPPIVPEIIKEEKKNEVIEEKDPFLKLVVSSKDKTCENDEENRKFFDEEDECRVRYDLLEKENQITLEENFLKMEGKSNKEEVSSLSFSSKEKKNYLTMITLDKNQISSID